MSYADAVRNTPAWGSLVAVPGSGVTLLFSFLVRAEDAGPHFRAHPPILKRKARGQGMPVWREGALPVGAWGCNASFCPGRRGHWEPRRGAFCLSIQRDEPTFHGTFKTLAPPTLKQSPLSPHLACGSGSCSQD